MKIDILNRLEKFYINHPDLQGKPLTSGDVEFVEKTLNVKLNSELVFFLKKFGGSYAGLAIHGLKNAESLGTETIIDLTLSARESENIDDTNFKKYVVFSDDGSGNPIYLNESGEVWVYDIDVVSARLLAKTLDLLIEDTFEEW